MQKEICSKAKQATVAFFVRNEAVCKVKAETLTKRTVLLGIDPVLKINLVSILFSHEVFFK